MTPVIGLVKASSFLRSDGFVYKPENVADDNLKTWWSPAGESIEDSWLKIDFLQEEKIKGIQIHGGSHYPDYANYGDIFKMNYRVKQATIEFSDGSTYNFTLKDEDKIQTIEFPPHNTRYIILTINSYYPTSKWKDICISHFVAVK